MLQNSHHKGIQQILAFLPTVLFCTNGVYKGQMVKKKAKTIKCGPRK